MSRRILFADHRGKLELNLFQIDGTNESRIMLELTPERPQTEPFPLSAQDARLFAAELMDYADQQDAVADTNLIPRITDNGGEDQ